MLYLGIDGGGTKTSAVFANEDKKILLRLSGKTINYYSAGMSAARNNLKEIISEASEKLGETEFKSVFIGSSALDKEATQKEIKEFTDGIINAQKIAMNSDLYVALCGCKSQKNKIIVISGTGSMALLQCGEKITKRGGWGHILGDEGSGYSISLSFLKKLVIMYDNKKCDELISAVCRHFGLSSFEEIIDFVYGKTTGKEKLASLCPLVLSFAQNGNELSLNTVTEECNSLFRTVKPLIINGDNPDIFLYGGVFQNSDFYRSLFCGFIKNEFDGVNVKLLNIPPEESALNEAYKL